MRLHYEHTRRGMASTLGREGQGGMRVEGREGIMKNGWRGACGSRCSDGSAMALTAVRAEMAMGRL